MKKVMAVGMSVLLMCLLATKVMAFDCTSQMAPLFEGANTGNNDDRVKLAWMYINGLCVKQNIDAAANYLQLAAEDGSSAAQFDLAVLYHLGKGVPQSDIDAYAWYYIAMEHATLSYERYLQPILDNLPEDVVVLGKKRIVELRSNIELNTQEVVE